MTPSPTVSDQGLSDEQCDAIAKERLALGLVSTFAARAMIRAGYRAGLAAQHEGEVTIVRNEAGEVIAVTRTDDEHQILSVIWQRAGIAAQIVDPLQDQTSEHVCPHGKNREIENCYACINIEAEERRLVHSGSAPTEAAARNEAPDEQGITLSLSQARQLVDVFGGAPTCEHVWSALDYRDQPPTAHCVRCLIAREDAEHNAMIDERIAHEEWLREEARAKWWRAGEREPAEDHGKHQQDTQLCNEAATHWTTILDLGEGGKGPIYTDNPDMAAKWRAAGSEVTPLYAHPEPRQAVPIGMMEVTMREGQRCATMLLPWDQYDAVAAYLLHDAAPRQAVPREPTEPEALSRLLKIEHLVYHLLELRKRYAAARVLVEPPHHG